MNGTSYYPPHIEFIEVTGSKIGHGVICRETGTEGTIAGVAGQFVQVQWPGREHTTMTAPRDLIWL